MKVRQILKLTSPDAPVIVNWYAYGVFYGSSLDSKLYTSKEVLDEARNDLLETKVGKIGVGDDGVLVILSEIVR